jgi:hypothetical protein
MFGCAERLLGDRIVKIASIHSCTRAGTAIIAAAAALSWTTDTATSATLTYTGQSCSSFTISGPAGAQTVTCVGGGSGGSVPVCSPTASPASPQHGSAATVNANCTNQPTAYVWTGNGCAGLTTASCSVIKPLAGSRTFTIQATNASGTSALAQITVTWQ